MGFGIRTLFVITAFFFVGADIASAGRLAGQRSLSDAAHGYAVVSDLARAGRQSQRFEVRAGDCGKNDNWNDCKNDRERSEISLRKHWQYGTDQWIAFSVYLPSEFQTSSKVRATVGQIHQEGGPSGKAGGLNSFPPMMQLEMQGSSYYLAVHMISGSAKNVRDVTKDINLASISSMRGRWTDIMIHFDTSADHQKLEVFVNDQKKAEASNWINFKPQSYFFKYGIYRSFVSRNKRPMPTQILYIDEVKMGSSRAKVEVDPKRPVD